MKYIVTVELVSKREKEITVYAPNEIEAEEKAVNIVLQWEGVEDANVVDVEEVE